MRVTGIGYGQMYMPQMYQVGVSAGVQQPQLVSKEWMENILNLVMYNQTGITYKLARIAAQMYAGLNLDVQA